MYLTVLQDFIYKGGDVMPKKASTVVVTPRGKKVYKYPQVGAESPGTPRLRDKVRRYPKKKTKKGAEMSEEKKDLLQRSVSDWEDLFKGGVSPDVDGTEGNKDKGQYTADKGTAKESPKKQPRPKSSLGAVAVNSTMAGAHDHMSSNADTEATDAGKVEKSGWQPYDDQVFVKGQNGEDIQVINPHRFEETNLLRGLVPSSRGVVQVDLKIEDVQKSDSTDEFHEISTEDLTDAQITLLRGLGYEDKEDAKDDKDKKPAFLKKKKMKEKACVKGEDVPQNDLERGQAPEFSKSTQRGSQHWVPGGTQFQNAGIQVPMEKVNGQAHVSMPNRPSSWSSYDRQVAARHKQALDAAQNGRKW